MKALLIIAGCLILAVALKVIEMMTDRKPIKSVGCKSNALSRNIATIDITDPVSIEEGLEHYRHLED